MLSFDREHKAGAVRLALARFCQGQITRQDCERTLRNAGWSAEGIKRHLDIAELNLKGVGHDRSQKV